MSQRSFGEDLRHELAGKAVMWGPAIAGALLMGPVGIFVGLAASVGALSLGSEEPSGSDSPKKSEGETKK